MSYDLTGERFRHLKVIKRADVRCNYGATWVCKCDCGNMKITNTRYLIEGSTGSCGCMQRAKNGVLTWTKEKEEELLKLLKQSTRRKQIAKQLGVGRNALDGKIYRLKTSGLV